MSNIVGLDLKIDQDYLANAVQQTVMMGISEALNGKNEIVSQIVNSVMQTKVDENGRISSYDRSNQQTLLEYYVRMLITDVVREEMKAMAEAKRGDIAALVKRALETDKFSSKLANRLVDIVIEDISDSWRTKIDINFDMIKKDY